MKTNKIRSALSVTLGLLLLLGLVLAWSVAPAEAANPVPLAAPTPVSEPRGAVAASVAELASGKVITADVRLGCIDTKVANKLDVYVNLTTGVVNTATVTLQHINTNPNAAGAAFADGPDVAAAVVTDTVAMQQVQAFGAWSCVFVDVTNANAITLTANALVK